ncbi:hypothetical protein G6675_06100 [Polynucleobacter paneuropaeus]|nr:hypothetical protein [Polynucleobacter paneuropaeus]MBT8600511.1 hypothetical protein [Polynucleobacter paneuropaeus]
MPTTKAPMTNSYKAIFIFAIVMSFVTLLAGNKGGIGTLFWGYVAWMMYKRNNAGLVTIFNLSLWLVAFSFFMGFVLLSNGTFDEKWFGYSAQGYFLTIIIVGAIDIGLLNYFKNLTTQGNPLINSAPAAPTPTSATPAPILRNSQPEAFTYKSFKEPLEDIAPKIQVSEAAMTDEQIYLKINDELESGDIDKALWLKLFSEVDGDENKTKAGYIRQRFLTIKNIKTQALVQQSHSDKPEQAISPTKIREYVNFYGVGDQTAKDMIKYKIWFQNDMFIYKTYRYEKVTDAIAFAKLEESKK